MKTSRFRYDYRPNSSKLHQKIGDALRSKESVFSTYKILQEYPVNKISPDYPNGRHKFDWVILDLKIVIEAMGKQHYEVVNWGGMDSEQAIADHQSVKERDSQKKEAALAAGFTYIEIPYWDYKKIDQNYIWCLYQENTNDQTVSISKKKELSDYEKSLRKRAKKYRQERYQRQKEYLKKRGGIKDGLSS